MEIAIDDKYFAFKNQIFYKRAKQGYIRIKKSKTWSISKSSTCIGNPISKEKFDKIYNQALTELEITSLEFSQS